MSFKLFALVLVASFASSSDASALDAVANFLNPCKHITLSGSPITLGCIVLSLCRDHSEERVKGFADCYDQNGALGKEQFFGCMEHGFGAGRFLNTTDNADYACKHFLELKPYADCLKPAFEASGVDGKKAVENVNICQGKVLGLGNGQV